MSFNIVQLKVGNYVQSRKDRTIRFRCFDSDNHVCSLFKRARVYALNRGLALTSLKHVGAPQGTRKVCDVAC